MATVNEELLDRAIRHALYVQRFKSTEVGDILKFLDRKVFPDITKKLFARLEAAAIAGIDRGPWTTAYLADIRKTVGHMTSAGFRAAGESFKDSMTDFAVSEAAFQTSLLKETSPLAIDFRSPAPELLRSIVTTKPVEGIPFGQWWKNLGDSTRSDIVGAVKTGLAQGEKPEQIIRRVTGTAKNGYKDGVYQTARHRAEAMVRTISSKIQNEATYASFLANADTIKGYQFVATLDTRTTVICMGHDGKVYDLKDRSGLPPLHWQCRSTIVAVMKSWDEIGLDGLGLNEPPPVATRASMNGEVPGNLAYPDWLKKQPEAIQNDALGFNRAEVFRRGVLKIDRFYDDHNRPLTLEQLYKAEERAKYAAAKRAQAAKVAAQKAAREEALAAAKAALAREKALALKYEQAKAAAERAEIAQQAAKEAEIEAKKLAAEKAAAEAAAIAQAQAEAAAAKAAEDALKAQAEIEAAQLAAEQAEHDAAIAATKASAQTETAAAAASAAKEAEQAVEAIHDAQATAKSIEKAAADAVVVPAAGASPIEYGNAAKAAVSKAFDQLEAELAAADVKVPGFFDTKKKALKQAYDAAWKKTKDLVAKGKTANLAEITKAAAEKATAEIKAAASAALADSVGAAEKAAADAVANAVAKSKSIEGAKAAGQAAKAEVDAAYAKLLAKKAGKISADEAKSLAEQGKKAAKAAYDKAWTIAKAAEKKAAKAAAKAGVAIPKPVVAQVEQAAAAAAKVEKAIAKAEVPESFAAWAKQVDEIEDASAWAKYGEQKGSNPGGFFRDEDGVEWYVKTPKTEEHAYNEVLAGRLYALTGTKSARTKLVRVNGKLSVASRIEKLDGALNKKGVVSLASEWKAAGKSSLAADGFATDAWLANWDAVGLQGDNLLFDVDGGLVRIDSGGALRFRAQGGEKGAAFGDLVNEIDTLRGSGPGSGTKAAQVFQHLTDKEIVSSIDRVLAVSEKDIAEVVEHFGPREVAERKKLLKKLLARREDLKLRRDYFQQRALGLKPARIPEKLADKWGMRLELKRQALSTTPIESLPESGPSFFSEAGAGDTRSDPVFAKKWKAWEKQITSEQKSAIRAWSGSSYASMRRAQVGSEGAAKLFGSNEIERSVLRVESALHHAPRYRGTIHRGINWDVDKHFLPNFEEGDVFELEAISSFSTKESTANSFAGLTSGGSSGSSSRVPVLFHVEDSYSGVDIKSLSSYGHEDEVLALRRSKYRVKRIKRFDDRVDSVSGRVTSRGAIHLYLEEISGKE